MNRLERQQILAKVERLLARHKAGDLGGEKMPEDVHPNLPLDGKELIHYFTLGMCLNYQRNSYGLWEACTATFSDQTTRWVFDPSDVLAASTEDLRAALLKYKVALQPNKHVENWQRVSGGICKHGDGDMRTILTKHGHDIAHIRDYIQTNKRDFPYLAGNKICNYWLYVLLQYTDIPLINKQALSVAPDTHVIQASAKLGLLTSAEIKRSDVGMLTAQAWQDVLAGTGLAPIDVHTPLWLWSRGGFQDLGI
ncbi:hypothetical protein [Maritalea sp.]|jgi:hypothetical protein|uniref:hypothetical protein n=1 Tax=Maritalea sp. TaxID=2003361 RepID=UPI0039E6F0F3